MGFKLSTKAGISICIGDMIIPDAKNTLIEGAQREVAEIENQYTEGLITDGERYNKVIDIWAKVTENIAKEMMKGISTQEYVNPQDRREVRRCLRSTPST